MSLAIRPLQSEDDVAAFIAIREAVDPEHPMTRESLEDARKGAHRLDVVAWQGAQAVGCAFAEHQWGDPASTTGYFSIRVLAEHRRHGVGTALLTRVSEHVRGFGGLDLRAQFRSEATDHRRSSNITVFTRSAGCRRAVRRSRAPAHPERPRERAHEAREREARLPLTSRMGPVRRTPAPELRTLDPRRLACPR